MPKNSMIINSKFRPYSYEEMLAPVHAATMEHRAIEDTYSNMASKANVWESLKDNPNEQEAYKAYKNYSDELSKQADLLNSEGLNANSRQALNNLKEHYFGVIAPIEKASAVKDARAADFRKLKARDSSLLFNKTPSDYSIKDYITNPNLETKYTSGNDLVTNVSNKAKYLAKSIRDDKNGEWSYILGKQYFNKNKQTGYTEDDIREYMQNSNDPKVQSALHNLVEESINASGVKNWGDAATIQRAYQYAQQGLYAAIGTSTDKQIANRDFQTTSKDVKTSKKGIKDQKLEDNSFFTDLFPIVTPNFKGKALKDNVKSMRNTLRRYPNTLFDKSGNLVDEATFSKSMKEYMRKNPDISNLDYGVAPGYKKVNMDISPYLKKYHELKQLSAKINNNSGVAINKNDLENTLDSLEQGGTALATKAYNLRVENPSKTFKDILGNYMSGDGDHTSIREIADIDKSGRLTFSSATVDVDDFIDSDTKDLKSTPKFLASPAVLNSKNPDGTLRTNQNGFIVSIGGKSYYLSAAKSGSIVGNLQQNSIQLQAAKEAYDAQVSRIDAYIQNNSNDPKKVEEALKAKYEARNALDATSAAFQRGFNSGLTTTLKSQKIS